MSYKFKTQNIKGKDYVPVNERLKYLDAEYRGRYSLTSVSQYNDKLNAWMCTATLKIDFDGKTQEFTGFSTEEIGSNMINKTSAAENCETSAWGRACAAAGIGIDSSIASSEEVTNAIQLQETPVVSANRPDRPQADYAEHLALTLDNKVITDKEREAYMNKIPGANIDKLKEYIKRVEGVIVERS